jgi:hypothetical protein
MAEHNYVTADTLLFSVFENKSQTAHLHKIIWYLTFKGDLDIEFAQLQYGFLTLPYLYRWAYKFEENASRGIGINRSRWNRVMLPKKVLGTGRFTSWSARVRSQTKFKV